MTTTRPRLDIAGVGRILMVLGTASLAAAIFFLAAGSFELRRAWLYYGGQLVYLAMSMAFLTWRYPQTIETVNARGKLHREVKTWDKVFGLVYLALLLIQPAVAGWDSGRSLSAAPTWPVSIGAFALTLLANAFVQWAMVANKHAETGVRIQQERQHAVVTTGPYRYVRHPFYIALIATALLYPLAVGALWAYLPSLLMAAAFVWRTAREDATLRRELEGYEAFTLQTRYRLLPGLW